MTTGQRYAVEKVFTDYMITGNWNLGQHWVLCDKANGIIDTGIKRLLVTKDHSQTEITVDFDEMKVLN